jgi:hypothetical protein
MGSDAFVVPSAWKRFVLPRRGAAASAPKPRATDVKAAEELLTAFDAPRFAIASSRVTWPRPGTVTSTVDRRSPRSAPRWWRAVWEVRCHGRGGTS